MPAGTAFANSLLDLILNATPIANVADDAATDPLTNTYVALYTAQPDPSNITTGEANYTGYAREAVARDTGSPVWTIAAGAATNDNPVAFGECTAGDDAVTHVGIVSTASGAGVLLAWGALSATRNIVADDTPSFAAEAITVSIAVA